MTMKASLLLPAIVGLAPSRALSQSVYFDEAARTVHTWTTGGFGAGGPVTGGLAGRFTDNDRISAAYLQGGRLGVVHAPAT